MNDATVSTIQESQNSTETEVQMIAYLEDLLSRQLEKLRKYDLDGAFQLAEQSREMADRVAGLGLLERPEDAEQKARLRELYNQICLVIATEREEVSEKLKQIREGIRVLSKYSGKS